MANSRGSGRRDDEGREDQSDDMDLEPADPSPHSEATGRRGAGVTLPDEYGVLPSEDAMRDHAALPKDYASVPDPREPSQISSGEYGPAPNVDTTAPASGWREATRSALAPKNANIGAHRNEAPSASAAASAESPADSADRQNDEEAKSGPSHRP